MEEMHRTLYRAHTGLLRAARNHAHLFPSAVRHYFVTVSHARLYMEQQGFAFVT